MIELDVLIIGVGTAGEYAAGTCLASDRSVGLIEKGPVGGECIFHACIPTKSLVHAARTYKKIKAAASLGLPACGDPVDYSKVKLFKDGIVESIGMGRDERWIQRGAQLFKGEARFRSAHEVEVGDEMLKAEKILITSGSVPAVPPIPGLAETGFITNVEAMEVTKVPERLAIIGGGPVGMEFAQVFSTFGAAVRVYDAADRVLVNEDEEVSVAMTGFLAQQGISISTSVALEKVHMTSAGKMIVARTREGDEQTEEFDEILVATGRKPSLEGLNLEAAGVVTHRKGITVDAGMRTNVPHIWAAGDVTGTFLFTYVAGEQGMTAAMNATGDGEQMVSYEVLPRATFCDPEVASVGLTENGAREKGFAVKVGRFDYADLTRGIISGETEGFFKIVAEEQSGRILGGHIVGIEASSLIHEISAAMVGSMTVGQIGNTLHSYPTFSEGVRYACQAIS